ncbi:CRISPR-associated helicase/endonuclease Cas3 [Xenorhabdus eapokensis]|uniref:CRISPR-associated helicase/endonuclease Cas3 n=1 Tax=Xenorhabdus eapokensis TaxID=1873482 RepID=A0A1Q5TJ65_9GAMM|nr:CRISPR-associated helicase/endonuclease Cas3 [Xenorhabdus eapokensis]OKP00270.1 CRISPR-associated helicase/endonuclease Cas3 [Xenorhabdus eapokensis]
MPNLINNFGYLTGYWGKAKKNPYSEENYHLLAYHCLDVAAVGRLLLAPHKKLTQDLANFLGLSPESLQNLFSFFLVLHDIGKFASAFQQLYSQENTDLINPEQYSPYDSKCFRHDRLGLFFWKKIQDDVLFALVEDDGLPFNEDKQKKRALKTLMILMQCMLGHHGKPIDDTDCNAITDFTEPQNVVDATAFTHDLLTLFQPRLPLAKLLSKEWQHNLKQVSWQLAGIVVLADWIGSDCYHFRYQTKALPLAEYWQLTQKQAQVALNGIDLHNPPVISPYTSIQEYYHFSPTPLQKWAEEVPIDDSPQLFILEDVTGAGKTEAALALTHRLMQTGTADGFYFGLPTMATSNAMFGRIAKHYHHMFDTENGNLPSIVLAHGAREMNDNFRDIILTSEHSDSDYTRDDSTATAQCHQWLADSNKKALLASVGVGTIDQALLAILPRKYQSLRLIGLNRKVLIFDEVHAADEYMFALLKNLLSLHLHQGGSVVLLTATLSLKQRQRLVDNWLSAGGISPQKLQQTAFPLATHITLNPENPLIETPLRSRPDVSRAVTVKTVNHLDECVEIALNAAQNGQCVVWVRNSVDDVLHAFRLIQAQMEQPENCLLFHSRFILYDRKMLEDRVLAIFGKESRQKDRQGKILITTQVFQESLDADTDVMISDICPIDDLIQRVGRLHRHTRNTNGEYKAGITDSRSAPTLYLHAPEWDDQPKTDWLSKEFRNTQYVYRSAGRLWLGLRELLRLGAIRMPAEARTLIEAVYGEDADEQIPDALKYKDGDAITEGRYKDAIARSQALQWQHHEYSKRSARGWYDDDCDISTRFSDIETVSVLLVKLTESGELIPWVEDEKFPVQLSIVKISKNKFADKLQPIPESLSQAVEQLQDKFKSVKYLQIWLPESDPHFTYDPNIGFYPKQEA